MELKVLDYDGKELKVYSVTKIFNETDSHFILVYQDRIKSALLSQDMTYDVDTNTLKMNFLLFPTDVSEIDVNEIKQKASTKRKKTITHKANIDGETFEVELDQNIISEFDI